MWLQDHRIFWIERDPQGPLSPILKWMAPMGIEPTTLALASKSLPYFAYISSYRCKYSKVNFFTASLDKLNWTSHKMFPSSTTWISRNNHFWTVPLPTLRPRAGCQDFRLWYKFPCQNLGVISPHSCSRSCLTRPCISSWPEGTESGEQPLARGYSRCKCRVVLCTKVVRVKVEHPNHEG